MKARAASRLGALAALLSAAACASDAPTAPPTSDAYATVLVGRLANLRDDHQAASNRFYHALQAAPSDPQLLHEALAAALATGDVDRTRQIAELAEAQEADVSLAYLVRGAEALGAGRWRTAAEKLARVRGSAAEELCERVLLAWARSGEGRGQAAAADLARIEAPSPFSDVYQYQRAMALDFAGDDEGARAAYAEAAASGVRLPQALVRHADLLARLGARDEALALMRAALAGGYDPEIEAGLARLEAGAAPAPAPLSPARGAAVGLFGLAELFRSDADPTAGLAAVTLALMLDPDFDAARIAYAEAQIGFGHVFEARAALARVSAGSPHGANAAMIEAWTLLDEGKNDEAVARAEAGAALAPNAHARRMLAEVYARVGRYDAAEAVYSELIAAAPEPDWRFYFARGSARERLGRWPEAEADLLRTLELAPERAEVLNYLGYSWVDRGERLTEALGLIQRAAQLRPQSGAVIDSLGWAYFRLGQYEDALAYLERAVELEPADAVLNDHLGDTYWRLGRRIEARFQWRRAISFGPEPGVRDAIARKLEAGLAPLPATASAAR